MLEGEEEARGFHGHHPLELLPRHAGRGDPGDLRFEQSADLADRARGTKSDRDPEAAGQLTPRLVGCHILGDLAVDHQLLVEPARLAPGQDVAEQAERGIVVVEVSD